MSARIRAEIRDTLPTRDAIENAVRERDLAALVEMDGRIRESVPLGSPVAESVARQAIELLSVIRASLERLGHVVALSDGGRALPLDVRVAQARQALDSARAGHGPDARVKVRAAAVRREIGG